MRQFLILLLFSFVNYANAQNTLSNNNESFDELVKSYATFIFKDNTKALQYAIKAKEVASISGTKEQITLANYYIANSNNQLDKNSIALQNIEAAIREATNVKGSLFLYECLLLKGNILSELGEDSKALIAYVEAKTEAKKTGDYLYEVSLLISIATIKKNHKDFEEAINIYKSILRDVNTLNNPHNRIFYKLLTLMSIADAYLWIHKPDEAEIYNTAGLDASSNPIKVWAYYPLLMNKAIISYQKAKYKEAIALAKQVRDSTKNDNEGLYLTSLFYLGKSSFQLKAYTESIAYLEEAYEKMSASENVDLNEKELHEFLALAYHEEQQPEKYLFHFKKYSALEKKQSIEDLKLNNETHELLDVSPLKSKIDTLDDALTKQTSSKKTLLIVSIALLLLFLSSIFYYKLREKSTKQKFKKLLKKVSELENAQEKKKVSRKDPVSDENVRVILDKIDHFEKKEYYLSTECSLNFMAEKLDTNATYLSKVINKYKKKSYSAYITELRINSALVRLKNDKKLQSYTIKAIAEEFGFKRQETFSRAFKTYTGIHPSQYLKNL